jgi:hypothetical protein
MNPIPTLAATLLAIVSIAAAAEHPAITQYRAYVAAVRAGDEKALLKLAIPVAKENQAVQLAHIRHDIALEQLRKETVAQLGPIDYKKDDGWMGTGTLPDEMIKDLKASEYKGLVGIMTKNPETGQMDLTIAIMKKVNGKWLMPLGMNLNFEAGDNTDQVLIEPKAEEPDFMLQAFNAKIRAVPQIIKRIQNKEFDKRSEVLSALTAASSAKVDGEIDK